MTAEAGPKKVLKVAVILRFTDQYYNTVQLLQSGIETAKTLFEKRHPDVSIQLIKYGHSEDLESVLNVSTQVASDGIAAAIGGEQSQESIVITDQLNSKKIVFITPTSSNPKVTEGKPYAFRGGFSDSIVAARLSQFMLEKLKPTVIGLIHNVSTPYTDYLNNEFLADYHASSNQS